jgi:hypothetical protein
VTAGSVGLFPPAATTSTAAPAGATCEGLAARSLEQSRGFLHVLTLGRVVLLRVAFFGEEALALVGAQFAEHAAALSFLLRRLCFEVLKCNRRTPRIISQPTRNGGERLCAPGGESEKNGIDRFLGLLRRSELRRRRRQQRSKYRRRERRGPRG